MNHLSKVWKWYIAIGVAFATPIAANEFWELTPWGSEQKPKLEIIELRTSVPNELGIVIRNHGEVAAYVNSLQLLVENVTEKAPQVCDLDENNLLVCTNPPDMLRIFPDIYTVKLELQKDDNTGEELNAFARAFAARTSQDIVSNSSNIDVTETNIESILDLLEQITPPEMNSSIEELRALRNQGFETSAIESTKALLSYLMGSSTVEAVLSKSLRLSQVVSAAGITSFIVRFEHQNGVSQNSYEYSGRAIISYDDGQNIATPDFNVIVEY